MIESAYEFEVISPFIMKAVEDLCLMMEYR